MSSTSAAPGRWVLSLIAALPGGGVIGGDLGKLAGADGVGAAVAGPGKLPPYAVTVCRGWVRRDDEQGGVARLAGVDPAVEGIDRCPRG
ncbi:hypothetical protein, partial [Salinispora arenicola]|uniref:hypothetical protein n=1 Tax=Salinispora arenicola TaxID=168697 RepID=UPI0016B2B471